MGMNNRRDVMRAVRNYRAAIKRFGMEGLTVEPLGNDRLIWGYYGRTLATDPLPDPHLTVRELLNGLLATISLTPQPRRPHTYTCTSGRGAACTCYACHGG